MKKLTAKTVIAILMAVILACLSACGTTNTSTKKVYKVGICNFVDDASLNQIVANVESQLKAVAAEKNVEIQIVYDNCNMDFNLLSEIIAKFIDEKVDLMVGIATPVAMAMQTATEENKIPVVFAAVSDPVACGVVASMEAPGANITGTSDMLNTQAIFDLMFAVDPTLDKVGLLYDLGQDSSTTAIQEAKEYLTKKGITIVEKTGTNIMEIRDAAAALVEEGVKAVFTPSDNTVMSAEYSMYEVFEEAGVLHYCGADSFALNGAFLGYGVNYANLGKETGNMVADILLNGKNPGEVAVMTFDNGIATVNEDIVASLGMNMDDIKKAAEPYCNSFQTIKTAEDFE